ncbi:MAG TPA: hypothetical protein VFN10_15710 [Thermoanaerobaculia bacterium]|nr:hypothetical protein [Thermoanaerobaculia bacterium]
MKRALVFALLFAAATAHASISGSWTADHRQQEPSRIQMMMSTRATSHFGDSMTLAELGLTDTQVDAAVTTPVQFSLRRDAGTVSFEGTFKRGDGAGHFTFTPNASYISQVRALGYTIEPRHSDRTQDDELFGHTIIGVSMPYLRDMKALFAAASLREMVNARAVGVTPEYVRDMRAMRVEIRTIRDATNMCAVGVTPEYVKQLAASGYTNLTARELMRLAAVGVDAEFIRKMSELH